MRENTIFLLDSSVEHEIADLYARVFAGPPWFEIKKCVNCSETYGKDRDLEQYRDGITCRRCGQPLLLVDYWYGGPALQVIKDAETRLGFIGVGARAPDNQVIAFSWGFAVPREDSPTVLFSQAQKLLLSHNLDPSTMFYAAETGVDPRYQGEGIGSRVSYTRIQIALEQGFDAVCFRTINPKMVKVFERFFGEGNVRGIFNDPDPVKSDRMWYVCSLSELRSIPR